ncbi:MAG: ATP-binding cassette domain-containing protein [Bacteroidales bacterium]|nr:ATP-binding cassette domain-containing protein [Bacteroidales bacterium]
MNNFLTANNVVKQFANHLALDKVSIHVPEGSIFGLLGPNGAGKTTLIRIITQITAPDQGEILFRGKKMTMDDIYHIGYLPEERGLYKKMKVGEQALYLVQLKGMSRAEGLKKLKFWFEKFEIQSWWDKKVEELSKGMAQKVQFIVTVLHDPKLLIFDEPFTGFDPINTNLVKNEILRLRDNGATIVFSTHIMASVEELCDHIALIEKGKNILEGNIDEVRARFKPDTYELKFRGDAQSLRNALNSGIEVQEEPTRGDVGHLILKQQSRMPVRDMVSAINSSVDIISFEEVIPSMNDIFIRAVEGNQSHSITSNTESHE